MKFFLLLFLTASILTFSQNNEGKKTKKNNVLTDAGDAAKLVIAKQKLYSEDFVGALNAYRDLEKSNPNNPTILYYIGVCHFNLKQNDKAKDFFLKSLASNVAAESENHFYLGKIYQIENEFDKAIDEFTVYKSAKNKNAEELAEADLLLNQCQNVKKFMANPLEVTVSNLGELINGRFDDKNPCITADGGTLVFTSRRPENGGSIVDVEGDGTFFEDIYISTYDSLTKDFGKALAAPGSINTKAHDAVTSISPDGKQIFIYKNDINDKDSRGGDIYVSKVSSGKWKTPEPIRKPIASSYWEGGACVSPDGKRYFFTSERTGGFGGSDIWMVQRITKNEWGKPENLGASVNTIYDEAGMFLAPDGKTLFFCSKGPKSMGSYDVFKTVYDGSKWSEPTNLGYPINSPAKEGQLTLSADAKFAYVSSDRPGGIGANDIYRIDLKEFAILEKDGKKLKSNGLSILKGTVRDGYEGYGLPDIEVVLSDTLGVKISSNTTNENGEYFFTQKGGTYKLTINQKGFKEISEEIILPVSDVETISIEKGYLLKK